MQGRSFRQGRALVCSIMLTVSGAPLVGAQDPATPVPVSVSGEVRIRSEWDNPAGGLHSDMYTYMRARLGVRADITPSTHLVLQGQDSRVFGAENNLSTNSPDVFDLHQGYLELSRKWGQRSATARVGRQEIDLGNERLVGSAGFSNYARSFDAVRVTLASKSPKTSAPVWSATIFAATMDEHGRHFGSTGTAVADNSDHAVIGAYATRTAAHLTGDATILIDDDAKYRRFEHANRTTFALHVRSDVARPIGLEVEGAVQQGHQQVTKTTTADAMPQAIRAWFGSVHVVRAPRAGRRTSATVGVDVLSGDGTPTDGTYSGFSTMYATDHGYYGLLDLLPDPTGRITDRGFTDAFVAAATTINQHASVKVELHQFAPQAGDRRPLGTEGNIIVPIKFSTSTSMDVGFAAFRGAGGASSAGLGAPGSYRQWLFLQLRAGF